LIFEYFATGRQNWLLLLLFFLQLIPTKIRVGDERIVLKIIGDISGLEVYRPVYDLKKDQLYLSSKSAWKRN